MYISPIYRKVTMRKHGNYCYYHKITQWHFETILKLQCLFDCLTMVSLSLLWKPLDFFSLGCCKEQKTKLSMKTHDRDGFGDVQMVQMFLAPFRCSYKKRPKAKLQVLQTGKTAKPEGEARLEERLQFFVNLWHLKI